MKHFLFVITLLVGQIGYSADLGTNFYCSFTEPFFSLHVDLLEKTITRTEPDWSSETFEPITFLIAMNIEVNEVDLAGIDTYQIKHQDEVIMTLAHNKSGSDGMSDLTYPISTSYYGMWGGCSTDTIDAVEEPLELLN